MRSPSPLKQPLFTALRSGIAVVIAILFVAIFEVKFGYWLILTTIIILQPTLGATLNKAKQRTIGTLLGVAVGSILILAISHSLLGIAICIAFLIFTCVLTRTISQAVFVFSGTIIAILLLNAGQTPNWEYAVYRMIDTLLGVSIGLGASFLLWPNWARSHISHNLCETIQKTDQLCCLVIESLIDKNPNHALITPLKLELENQLDNNKQFLQQAMQELTLSSHRIFPALAIINSLEKIQALLHTCHMLSTVDLHLVHPDQFAERLSTLEQEVHEAFSFSQGRILYPSEKYERQETRHILSHLATTPELPQDRSLPSRFLHRQVNLLYVEMNHLVHAVDLLETP